MRLGISQHARMEQRLVQSPQMIQAMQILQLSSLDLHERIEQELLENPLLEVREGEPGPEGALEGEGLASSATAESVATGEAGSEEARLEERLRDSIRDEIDRYQRDQEETPARQRNDGEDGDRKLEAMANTPDRPRSLAAALLDELALVELTDRQRTIAEFIAYSLDERGYLPESLEEVAQACTPEVIGSYREGGGAHGGAGAVAPAAGVSLDPSTGGVGSDEEPAEQASGAGASTVGPPSVDPPSVDPPSGAGSAQAATFAPGAERAIGRDASASDASADQSENDDASRETADLPPEQRFPLARRPVDAEEVAEVLTLIRQVTHPGIGAVDLQDCLLLQLEARGVESPLVHDLVEHHLEDVTKNRLPRVAKVTGHSIDEIKAALELVRELDPSPGREYGEALATAIIPDVVVDEIDGELAIRLGRQRVPDLQVDAAYEQMLEKPRAKAAADDQRATAPAPALDAAGGDADAGGGDSEHGMSDDVPDAVSDAVPDAVPGAESADPETRRWLKKRLESARWFIDALEQRRSTVLRIADAIFAHQREFLAKGPKALKPLRMQEIADQTGVHISTVSRAVAGKHAQTSRGIFPLKYFFTSGTTDESGAEASQVAIQQRIRELVDGEDGAKPLSDEQLAAALHERHGIKIARRTVTKYRKMLQIPSSSERRTF